MIKTERDTLNILFILRSIGHLSYHESTIRSLSEKGHKVHLLFSSKWSRGFPDLSFNLLKSDIASISHGWMHVRNDFWSFLSSISRNLRTCANYRNMKNQDSYYLTRWIGYLPIFLRIFVRLSFVQRLISSKFAIDLYDRFERFIPVDKTIVQELRSFHPDVVIASPVNLRFSEEVEYVKASLLLRIPTGIAVISWDNLTTKGLFHVVPDKLFVWNRIQEQEAINVHNIPKNRITITGSPFFDKWFSSSNKENISRNIFLQRIGLNENQPFALYLGSSANIAKDETWLVKSLSTSLTSSTNQQLRNLQILVRPHGANKKIFDRLNTTNITVWPWKEVLPDTPESMAEFAAAMKYAICSIGLNTSAMVDAILAECPVIALTVKEYQDTNAMQAIHFRYLLDADIYERASSPDECLKSIALLMNDRHRRSETRQKFISDFIRPFDIGTPAGAVSAQAIEQLAGFSDTPHAYVVSVQNQQSVI